MHPDPRMADRVHTLLWTGDRVPVTQRQFVVEPHGKKVYLGPVPPAVYLENLCKE